MNDGKLSNKTIIQAIMLIGAIYLASVSAPGWGWLLFFFFLTLT